MRDQELLDLYNAYKQVYTPQNEETEVTEEVENLDERKYQSDEKLPSGKTPRQKAERAAGAHGARYRLRQREPGVGRNDQAASSHFSRGSTIHTVMKSMDAGEEPHKDPKWKNTIAARRRPRDSYEVPNERPGGLRARNTTAAREDDQGRIRSHRAVTRKEETELFNSILEYLVAEGYADTNENAVAIMANMSDEWKQSIVEAKYSDNDYRAGGGDEKRLRTNMSTVEVSRLGRENINRLIDKEPLGTKIKQKLFGREVPVPPNSNIPQNTLFYNRMLPDWRSSGRPRLHGDPLPGPRAKYYGPAR